MSWIHPITGKKQAESLVGVVVPMFTPVDKKGEIDEAGLRAYTERLASDPNVTALFWRSGVGRMYTFTVKETKRSLDIVVDVAAGRKPVFCGAAGEFNGDFMWKTDSGRYLHQTLSIASYAKELGAGIALVIPAALPVYPSSTPSKTTAEYVKAVHDEIEIPILLYDPQNVPAEYHSTPELIREIAALPRVVGAKISTTDMHWLCELNEAAGDNDFVTIVGSERAFYQAILTGASAVAGQGCSIYPKLLRFIFDAVENGEYAKALQAQCDVNRAIRGFLGLPPDRSGFAYLRKKKLKVSPYCRDGSEPLGKDVVEQIVSAIDPIVRQYG